jgi:hypothetical protein
MNSDLRLIETIYPDSGGTAAKLGVAALVGHLQLLTGWGWVGWSGS